jgi:uncharacterized protein
MKSIVAVVLISLLSCAAQTNGKALYEQALNKLSGSNIERSGLDAAALMRRSAESGYAPAQTALGYWLENGENVAASQTEALDWYRKAAHQNDKFAWYALGRAYALGIGTAKDEAQARAWLKKAADAGNAYAMYYMALTYESLDPDAYRQWLFKAAEAGLPQAERRLADALLEPRGTTRDVRGAYMWMLIAQSSGMEVIDDRLRLLESEIGGDVDNLQQRARDRAEALQSKRRADPCSGFRGELDEPPALPPPDIQRKCR